MADNKKSEKNIKERARQNSSDILEYIEIVSPGIHEADQDKKVLDIMCQDYCEYFK